MLFHLPTVLTNEIYIFSDDENITNPKVTIDQEDLDFDINNAVEIRSEIKLSTPFTSRSSQDEDNLEKMISRVTMNDEVDIDNMDIGSGPIFENSRHLDVQLPLDNDFPLWAGDTSARRSPEGTFVYVFSLYTYTHM